MEPLSTTNQKTTPTKPNQSSETIALVHENELQELKKCLPRSNFMGNNNFQLLKIQNFWYFSTLFPYILTFQRHFQAQDTDLIVTSFPKTGTTWLKSLLFSVINRTINPPSQSPLLTHNPHQLVYELETGIYGGHPNVPKPDQLSQLPAPRLLHSHLPYESLPQSIKDSDCKLLYICRNPLDTLVSHWKFYPNLCKKVNQGFEAPSMEDFFEDFCQGKVFFGPYLDHVIGYWKLSLECPNKVLFLRYEDLKENPGFYLKKLGEFVGKPFSDIEESEGVIEEIIELCSFNNLKELEVNKSGVLNGVVENKAYFREGEVGGWANYLTPSMVEKMKMLMEQKLEGTGLSFKW